jgi:hypothetical protein
MAPSPNDPGWERWCGQHEARITGIEDDVKALFHWRDAHEAEEQRKYTAIVERLTSVETKLIFFAAIAAAVGSMLPNVLAAVLKHL